jgi:RNA polymerase sigma-70 factor (ECF subfamily)
VSDPVGRAQQGDHDAFEQLYRLHAGRVYALCLRMAGDAVEARRLTQDVFVRAWERLSSFRGESAFSSWLHRLAVNVVLADRRAAGRRLRRVVTSSDAPAHDGATGGDWTPERLDLEEAIAALPPGARAVFVLYDIEGYGHEEIAAMTGIAVGTSKAQLHRARRLLREALER